jgi:sugar (pentulose or hexulose) kinase
VIYPGIYADYAEASANAVTIERVHEPISANTPLYLERYDEYEHLVEVMQNPWDALSRLD